MVTITEKDTRLQYTEYLSNLQKISKHFTESVRQMDNLYSEWEQWDHFIWCTHKLQ